MEKGFLLPLANAKDYPPAKLSMLPAGRVEIGASARRTPDPCVAVEYMASARGLLSAIAEHFRGRSILLPAYHCPAMVEPFLFHQCQVQFYRVDEKLEFDQAELEEKLPGVDVVVGVRFFGFSCKMATLKLLAAAANTLLVEDLAHAAYASDICGDFAVTSLKKFYPIATGAELYIAHPSWAGKIRRSVRSLTPTLTSSLVKRAAVKFMPRFKKTNFRYFSPSTSHALMARADKHLLDHYDHQQSASRRRANFLALHERLKDLSFAQALFPALEDEVVPYVYPMRLKEERFFSLIRQRGIPLYRWEELIESDCSVSMSFRRLLIQLPCHQDLSESDIDFITDTLREIDQQQEQP